MEDQTKLLAQINCTSMALFLGSVKMLGGEAKYAAVSFAKMMLEKQRGIRDKLQIRRFARREKIPDAPLEFSLHDKAGRRMAICIEIEREVPTNVKPRRSKQVSLFDLHVNMLISDRLKYDVNA